MNRVADVFGTSPVLLPVVHPVGRAEALAAIHTARSCGVRGVFLVDQGMSQAGVLALACEARSRFPGLWIGLNLLSLDPADALISALAECEAVDGIWSDDAGVDEHRSDQPRAQAFDTARRALGWNGLYFGGVAFKYQRAVAEEDLGRAAELAVPHVDVICTSGPATGQPAAVSKVRAMRAQIGDHALALASGVTAKNVRSYLPHVQAFLVGTGIEKSFGVLEPAKIEALLLALQDGIADA